MKTIKKISVTLATMLLGLVVVGLCPFMGMKAEAAVSIDTDGAWHPFDTNCKYMFEMSSKKLTIEATNSGAKINDTSFMNNTTIEILEIKGDATNPIEIGAGAFFNNTGLTKVKLSGVSSIDYGTFLDCHALQEVTLPEGLETISRMLFKNCYPLENIIIPNSVKIIKSEAFAYTKVENIVIPDNVTEIESIVFRGCSGLKSVTLPAKLEKIGNIFDYGNAAGVVSSVTELTFRGDISMLDKDASGYTDFVAWINHYAENGPLHEIRIPDKYYDNYMNYAGFSDDVKALFHTYTLDSSHGGDDHEGGSSNDDDSRPAPPTPHQLAQELIFRLLDEQLAKIDPSTNGQAMVDGEDLVNALPNTVMNKIAEYPNVTVFFTYNYNEAKYTTAIPAGTAIDSSLEWYGPIYMMTHYPTMWHQDANTSVPVVAPVQ